jgi:hypothetical protein
MIHTVAYPLPMRAAEGRYVMTVVISEAQPPRGRQPRRLDETAIVFVISPATTRSRGGDRGDHGARETAVDDHARGLGAPTSTRQSTGASP